MPRESPHSPLSPYGTSQKLLKAQQLVVLKDPFPQGQNSASASNVAGGNQTAPDPNYINMVRYSTLLQTTNTNYENETPEKGKAIGEPSNPLTIEKPAKLMPKIPKGVLKKTLHNPNARAAENYSVVKYLAKNPCAMSALELLQSCPAQRDALLAALGSMDSSSLMAKFNLSDVKIHLPYHVALSIEVIHGGKTIGRKLSMRVLLHLSCPYLVGKLLDI